jgi:hypothetical protein
LNTPEPISDKTGTGKKDLIWIPSLNGFVDWESLPPQRKNFFREQLRQQRLLPPVREVHFPTWEELKTHRKQYSLKGINSSK